MYTSALVQSGSQYTATLKVQEYTLYGASRLGTHAIDLTVSTRVWTGGSYHTTTGIYSRPGTPVSTGPHTFPQEGYISLVRGQKRYELSNHLGNVLAVVSDRKLQVTATWSTAKVYAPDVLSYTDYYAFGWEMPGRSSGSYRYGFNGKEDDVETGWTDFGARMYDGRSGRWSSVDPLSAFYSGTSPYVVALNSPLMAKDADGRLVIYINGEVGNFSDTYYAILRGIGVSTKESDPNNRLRANIDYWGVDFVNAMQHSLSQYPDSYMFRDGDKGSSASSRKIEGRIQARQDAETIFANLQRDENGKIVETIDMVSHSKGAAYSNGYVEGLREYIDANRDEFADPENVLRIHIMLAPHQSWAFSVKNSKMSTVTINHETEDWYFTIYDDYLSDSHIGGDAYAISTTPNFDRSQQWYKDAPIPAHGVAGFTEEATAIAKQLVQNHNESYSHPGYNKYRNLDGLLKDQISVKKPENE